MEYSEIVRFVGIIDRGLARFAALRDAYTIQAINGTRAAMIALYVVDGTLAKKISGKTWKEQALEMLKRGMLGEDLTNTIRKITKADDKIADWQKVKALHLKSLTVSAGHGFSVQAISISKKGMMVTVSHPKMKKPVTRHLLRKNGIYTGRAPFGAETFIEYKVTIAGDLQVVARETNPASGAMDVLDNAA
jgi:hypothetical protein